MNYNFSKIESKWQKTWEKAGIYRAKGKGKKWYSLFEFPYPSGDGLHVGHLRPYVGMDVISRKRRMEGYDVLFPVGWDAFGLPTENYALKTGIPPDVATKRNTDNFRRQIKSIGTSLDWSREINTTDPEYYKWTQWMFLKFFKKGLAYKAAQPINWCPRDKIGLANEEAVGGVCDRCGGPVETRMKEQWMLKITAYADKLLEGLKEVDYIPRAKVQQENWIGKSEGAEIEFRIKNLELSIKVFTTRPDTLFGVTFLVVSPEFAQKWFDVGWKTDVKVRTYVKRALAGRVNKDNEDKPKTGVFSGVYAVNPANKEKIPVWISDYVLAGYGTGAIMAVPAHDARDFAFAKKFKLPIREVVEPLIIQRHGPDAVRSKEPFKERNAVVCIVKHWAEEKYLCLKWKKIDWRGFVVGGIEEGEDMIEAGKREIEEETGYANAKFVRQLGGVIHSQFYHVLKNENRWAYFNGLYFELKSEKRLPVSEKEQAIHDVLWFSPSEIGTFLNADDMRLLWERIRGGEKAYDGDGILINSGKFSGMDSEKAKWEIIKFVGGKRTSQYRLRDWVFSRQRYWGEPIPLVFCEHCKKRGAQMNADRDADRRGTFSVGEKLNAGWVPVPEKELPVKLPKVKNYKPRDDGQSPLASVKEWVNVKCPRCKGPAKRETDTMPNWAGSSWYFLRYVDPKNKKTFASRKALGYWMGPWRDSRLPVRSSKSEGGVDWYNGGMEHTVLHLLYSRFWNRFLYDQKLVPTAEPYKKRTSHGIVLAKGGVKMSKSKGNVINPDDIVKRFGADTLRLYEMFLGPFDQAIAWDERGILGTARFLERVWKVADMVSGAGDRPHIEVESHKLVKKVGEDIESMSFNTAVSAMMIFINSRLEEGMVTRPAWQRFLSVLAPFAPHMAEELWARLGNKKSIHVSPWPSYDPVLIQETTVTIIVQVNGKVRGLFEARADISQKDAEAGALALPRVREFLGGAKPKRIIYIPGRLVNIVL